MQAVLVEPSKLLLAAAKAPPLSLLAFSGP